MEENSIINSSSKNTSNNLKGDLNNERLAQMDLSECGKYQELSGSWVLWMLISGVILCFKNLYGGISLILISIVIFLIYKRSPKNISATYFNIALDFIGKNEMEKAKKSLMEAVKVNSENRHAFILIASIYYREGNCADTIDNLLKSGVINSKESKYSFVVGECYYRQGDYKNSIKYLSNVKYEKGDLIRHIKDVLLAKAYCFNGQYEEAMKIFSRILNIKDEYKGKLIEFNYCLGLTYLKLGDKENGNKFLAKVYKEDKEYRDIKNIIID